MEEASGKDSCLINQQYLRVINILGAFKLKEKKCSKLVVILYRSRSLWSLKLLDVAEKGS